MNDLRAWIRKDKARFVYIFLFSLLSVAFDVAVIWPSSHFFALLFGACAVSLVAWVEVPELYFPQSAMTFFLVAFTAWLVIGPALPDETETHGWLLPANDLSASTACPDKPWGIGANFEVPEKAITVALGHNGVVIPFFHGKIGDAKDEEAAAEDNEKSHTILTVGSCKAIVVARKDNKLLINADVFDSDGHLSATIQNNEFHLVQAQIAYPQRPDRSTLVVTGRDKEELFWIRYLNPRSVKIRGYFACKNVPPVHIAESEITFPPDNHFSGSCMISHPNSPGIFIGNREFSE
jgi:hypothetical protein